MTIATPFSLKSRTKRGECRGKAIRCSLWAGCAAAACALLLAACGSPRPIKYYQVNYPTQSVTPETPTIDATLMVRQFEASHLYLDDKMVYGFDSPEMGTYEYQRWSEPPVEILQNAIVRGLRATGQFKAVYTLRADPGGRFVVAGQIYDFREVDGANIVARLSYQIRLRDRKNGTTVWQHVYNYDEPATEKSVPAFVIAMDKNLQRSIQEVASGLQEYFRAHPVE
jgi:ABC-type uncharacterized transport system auxiliary subunit